MRQMKHKTTIFLHSQPFNVLMNSFWFDAYVVTITAISEWHKWFTNVCLCIDSYRECVKWVIEFTYAPPVVHNFINWHALYICNKLNYARRSRCCLILCEMYPYGWRTVWNRFWSYICISRILWWSKLIVSSAVSMFVSCKKTRNSNPMKNTKLHQTLGRTRIRLHSYV